MITKKTAPVPPTNENALMTLGNIMATPIDAEQIRVVTRQCSHVFVFPFFPIKANICARQGAWLRVTLVRIFQRTPNLPICRKMSFMPGNVLRFIMIVGV